MTRTPTTSVRIHGTGTERGLRWAEGLLLLVAAIFLALHAVHLTADFPNHSPWRDWAKFTDEGWYGDAAIRFYQRGQWNLPGDFNPAAALPVWPALELILFRFTGVNVVAARALSVAVFAGILLSAYFLIRRWAIFAGQDEGQARVRPLAPALAVLLLAVSPFFYVFSRLAILEPLLMLLTLLACHAASATGLGRSGLRRTLSIVALGCLLPMMVLTKTTAVFLFPSIFWLLWAASGHRLRPFLRAALPASALAAAGWLGYFFLLVRPRYLADYRYLFSANRYTGITRATFLTVIGNATVYGIWMGRVLYLLGLLSVVAALIRLGSARLRRNPLPLALVLWFCGYAAFLIYHDNLQPRYYVVLALPLTLLVAIMLEQIVRGGLAGPPPPAARAVDAALVRGTCYLALAAIAAVVVSDARDTLRFVRHPEYSYIRAAEQVQQAIARDAAAHPEHSRLVLSVSGSELALMSGVQSICDDFGTLTLPDRIAKYHPGWFAAWNEVEDDKMEALDPMYRVERVGSYAALDDPERNLLILYRLEEKGSGPGSAAP